MPMSERAGAALMVIAIAAFAAVAHAESDSTAPPLKSHSTVAHLAAPPVAAPTAKAEASAAKVSADPQSTQATYGDWVVRCQMGGAEGSRQCEAAQIIQVEKQPAPIAQMAIGRVKKSDFLRLTILLPVSVAFPSAPKLLVDVKDQTPVELTWSRCLPGGCVADTELSEETLQRLRGADGAGAIVSTDATGQVYHLPVSFRGLEQALNALAKET